MSIQFSLFLSLIIGLALFGIGVAVCRALRLPAYHPALLYLAYFGLGYILRPFTILSVGESDLWLRIGYPVSAGAVLYSTLMSGFAFLSFYFGVLLAQRFSVAIPFQPAKFHVAFPVRLLIASTVLSALGLYGTYSSYGFGGTEQLQQFSVVIDDAGGQRLDGVSGYSTALAEFLPALLIILLLCFRFRWWVLILIVLYGFLRFYIGAQRLSIVVVVLAALLLGLVWQRKLFFKPHHMALGILFLFIFELVGSDRLALRRIVAGEAPISSFFQGHVENRGGGFGSDFKEFDVATVIYDVVPEFTGYNFGSQYLRLAVWPIPRQLWNDKPVYTSKINLNEIGNFFGLTWSLNADLYSNFGPTSLWLGMFLVGFLLSKAYIATASTSSPLKYSSYWILIVYIATLFRDGGVTVVYFWAFSFLAVAVLVWAGRLQLVRDQVDKV